MASDRKRSPATRTDHTHYLIPLNHTAYLIPINNIYLIPLDRYRHLADKPEAARWQDSSCLRLGAGAGVAGNGYTFLRTDAQSCERYNFFYLLIILNLTLNPKP